jgi:hypothetical protein
VSQLEGCFVVEHEVDGGGRELRKEKKSQHDEDGRSDAEVRSVPSVQGNRYNIINAPSYWGSK